MRVLAALAVALVIVLGWAGPASAGYLWSFNATSPSNTDYGTAPTIGYEASSAADSQVWTTTTRAYAAVVILDDPAHPGTSTKSLLSKRYWINAPPDLSEFYVQLWAASGYVFDTFDFRIWCPISSGPYARPLTVKIVYDPVGSLAGTVLGTVATTTGHSQASPTRKWNLPVYKTDTPMEPGCGYILKLYVGGFGPTVWDDGATTTNPTRLHAMWSVNPEAMEYEYSIGTASDTLVGWKSAGTATEATEEGLSLQVGQMYYSHVRTFEEGNGWTDVSSSDGITVAPPAAPAVTDDGAYCFDPTSLHASWTTPDPWGVQECQYAIGKSPSELVVDWKTAGANTEVTETPLELDLGETYYFYAKYRNGGGLWSETGNSDGIGVVVPCTVGEAKTTYAGKPVFLQNAVVASAVADFPGLWIESQNRSAGIRVDAALSATRGQTIDVAGVGAWVDGIPRLTSVELKGSYDPITFRAPCFTSKTLANDPTESLAYRGMNPVGLLTTICGNTYRLDTQNCVFYIDDGSKLADGMGPSYDPFVGLRVSYKSTIAPPIPGTRVRVTGIRTVEKVTLQYGTVVNGQYRFPGETLYLPVLKVRDQSDIITPY